MALRRVLREGPNALPAGSYLVPVDIAGHCFCCEPVTVGLADRAEAVLVRDNRAFVAEEVFVLPLGTPPRVGIAVVGVAAGWSVIRINRLVVFLINILQNEV